MKASSKDVCVKPTLKFPIISVEVLQVPLTYTTTIILSHIDYEPSQQIQHLKGSVTSANDLLQTIT